MHHYRLFSPSPEIEAEFERLCNEWYNLPADDDVDVLDYVKGHCSEAAKAYMRECDEIRAQLKPGEYV